MEADRKFICFFPCYTKKKVSRVLTWNLVVLTVGKLQSAAMSKQYWPWYPPSLGSFLQTNKEYVYHFTSKQWPPSKAPNFIAGRKDGGGFPLSMTLGNWNVPPPALKQCKGTLPFCKQLFNQVITAVRLHVFLILVNSIGTEAINTMGKSLAQEF